jgi:hypothetical protein
MSTKTKIYISGAISNLNYDEAFNKFQDAENWFLNYGFFVINPMKLPHQHDKSWESYMKEDLKFLMDCDSIAFLDNYYMSRGAMIELKLAKELKLKTFYRRQVKYEHSEEIITSWYQDKY